MQIYPMTRVGHAGFYHISITKYSTHMCLMRYGLCSSGIGMICGWLGLFTSIVIHQYIRVYTGFISFGAHVCLSRGSRWWTYSWPSRIRMKWWNDIWVFPYDSLWLQRELDTTFFKNNNYFVFCLNWWPIKVKRKITFSLLDSVINSMLNLS